MRATNLIILPGFLLAGSCGTEPPTAADIRAAYAAHMKHDPVHARGLQAKAPPTAIPQQDPVCTPDGRSHFDCNILVIFETAAGPRSQEQRIHIRREEGAWIIDSVN